MSLATRCVSCGTVFRVVQDQLKVSEGWVRCGRCDEVFNAVDSLFDLERDAPPGWKPPDASMQPPAAEAAAAFAPPEHPPQDDDEIVDLGEDDRIHSRFFHIEQLHVDHSPADNVDERDRVEFADASFNEALLAEPEATVPDPMLESTIVQQTRRSRFSLRGRVKNQWRVKGANPIRSESEADEPEFLRRAKSHARWNSGGMRVALVVGIGLLAGLLLTQLAVHDRDVVAARWPSLRGPLTTVCGWVDCRIEAPRRIADITVESSSLAPAEGGTAYRLSLQLRNRGPLPVAMPSIDLSLTDAGGQLIARRALSPADFAAAPSVIPAESEAPVQLLLASNGPRLSGYTVEVFYP